MYTVRKRLLNLDNYLFLIHWETGGRWTKIYDGPTWDNPKLRHFYWLLNRRIAAMADENDVICVMPPVELS